MGKTEELAMQIVKEGCAEYYVNRNTDYIMARCASMNMPLIGLVKPEWEEEYEIESDYQQVKKLSENIYMVSTRINLKDTSFDAKNDNFILVDGTFACIYEEDEIRFVSVHLSKTDGIQFEKNHTLDQEPYYKRILKSTYDVVFEYDNLNNYFTYDPVRYRELFESDTHFVSMDQWFWHLCSECVLPEDTEALDIFRSNDIGKRIRTDDCVVENEIRIRNREKGFIWIKMVVVFIPNKKRDNLEKVFAMFKNIDDKKRKEVDYITKSRVDSLTGLYNREHTDYLIKTFLEENIENRGIYVIIDIDEFKGINDTFGHITGDELLKRTAKALENSVSSNDIVGRMGGDEFVIFLKHCQDEKIAKSKLSNILKSVQFEYNESKKTMTVHCSAGAAIADSRSRDMKKLYERADENLYDAKRAGKNTFKITTC